MEFVLFLLIGSVIYLFTKKVASCGCLAFVGIALIMVGWCDEKLFLGLLGGAVYIVSLIFAFKIMWNRLVDNAIAEGKKLQQEKIDFYNECRKNGVSPHTSTWGKQKATLIAERMNLSFTTIEELYEEAKTLQEEKQQEEEKQALEALRKKETNRCDWLNHYSDKVGRDKRVAMLTDLWKAADDASGKLISGAASMMAATQQKEQNWAIQGGIASGLAGPAAGVAVAVESQLENLRIQQRNKANLEAYAPLANTMFSGAGESAYRAAEYKRELEEARIKVVAPDSKQDCMKQLIFSGEKVTISKTGTCTVEVRATLKDHLKIDGSMDAVIDGTLNAHIYDGKKCIGTALMVLPKNGIYYTENLVGMCLFCGEPGKQYTVKFTAKHLWLMEK